jgi:PQQ-dependent dehydrogenase (methanol/ethanol family)
MAGTRIDMDRRRRGTCLAWQATRPHRALRRRSRHPRRPVQRLPTARLPENLCTGNHAWNVAHVQRKEGGFMSVRHLPVIVALAVLAACSESPPPAADATATAPAGPDDAVAARAEAIRTRTATLDASRIVGADSEPGNWLAHGRTYDEQRFSPLSAINRDTVGRLGLAWYADTGTTRGLEASPIVVDGVMFSTGPWSLVYAHDAKTGELIWQYDPQVPREWGVNACCDVVNRGVAVWKGRVYVGTIDGRLVALDAGDGKVAWEVLTIDRSRPYTITGAPRIVRDKVIIGNGGAEYGVRGYITAYDAATGGELWRFYTVPGDPAKPFEGPHLEAAAKTWQAGDAQPAWWQVGGGGTAWDSMAYDPALNLLYVGTGNGSPWNRHIRSPGGGDNLYLSSILAIDPDAGTLVWHYQTTPGDTWDYTATQHLILADLTIDGQPRKVIMQAPKNGFFYVLDRSSGEFISAQAYVPVTWAKGIDQATGRPIEDPQGDYATEPKLVRPAPYGGHNWHPMSFSRQTNLVYIPALDIPFLFAHDGSFRYNPATWNTGLDFGALKPPADPASAVAQLAEVKGHLAAWDPVTQREVWRVQHAGAWNGGVLSTAGGLVFQGRADGHLAAYAADTGAELWSTPTYTGIIAPPVTYEVDGEQYVAVLAGWGGAFGLASGVPPQAGNRSSHGRLLAYRLGGSATLPEPPARDALGEPPPQTADAATIDRGEALYHAHCAVCHGPGASGSGVLPDLRRMQEETHAAFDAIVLRGAFAGKGMVGFSHVLDEAGAAAIHAYLIRQAHGLRAPEAPQAPAATRPPT